GGDARRPRARRRPARPQDREGLRPEAPGPPPPPPPPPPAPTPRRPPHDRPLVLGAAVDRRSAPRAGGPRRPARRARRRGARRDAGPRGRRGDRPGGA